MKVRSLRDVAGTVLGDTNGLRRGQIVDWPDEYALRQMHFGHVEHPDAKDQTPEERKAWADKAREAMRAQALPHLEEIQRQYEDMRRGNISATADTGRHF
jgi:hypothetical protein